MKCYMLAFFFGGGKGERRGGGAEGKIEIQLLKNLNDKILL